ncbi:hypothetical protein GW765_03110 [Candidatus Parcubacteria bacterium]|nr:hypothetical protein [Candidatus Parcubacteria bacterium]
MENEISEIERDKLINKLESEQQKWIADGDIPKEERWQPGIINIVVKLLKQGNLSSAKDSFKWESDKLMTNRSVYDFMADLLGVENIFTKK